MHFQSEKVVAKILLPSGVTPDLAAQYANHSKQKIDMFEISCGCNTAAIIRPDITKLKLINHTY